METPLQPLVFSMGAGARFIARGFDTQKTLPEVFKRAHAHKGTSMIEILQNCIVYNDEVFSGVVGRDVAADNQVHVVHGEPLIFGADKNKGIRLNAKTLTLEAVTIGENGVTEDDILIHDETNRSLAILIAAMNGKDRPVAMGVIYCNPTPTYEDGISAQVNDAKAKNPDASMDELLRRGHTWEVE